MQPFPRMPPAGGKYSVPTIKKAINGNDYTPWLKHGTNQEFQNCTNVRFFVMTIM